MNSDPMNPLQPPPTLKKFYTLYLEAGVKSGFPLEKMHSIFEHFCKLAAEHAKNPHHFQPFHKAIRTPFDYYEFGHDFVRPLLDFAKSSLTGEDTLQAIEKALNKKENVILLYNHQTEIDPQVISLFLGKKYPKLASEMIFVAGHRVVQDPLASPLSLGRNLFCIYSKKYIDHPPEKKAEKIQHNRRTLSIMEEMLSEGEKCICIAPSGGRDRMDESGKILPSPFDPDSVEMFYLIAKKSGTACHFHPLSLYTYPLLPPPQVINVAIGEERSTSFSPAHLTFGAEIDMEKIIQGITDKQARRKLRAETIWQQVVTAYKHFPAT